MFIGREKELTKLNQLYKAGSFQLPVIYGRRRVGKTALINEFVKEKKAIFFTAIESNAKQNLENLSNSIFTYMTGQESAPVFSSFQAALQYIFDLSKKEQLILVMDEYPCVAKADKSLSLVLQHLIDKNKDDAKLFLILCGSSMSFMEEQVLGYESPLYGRRTSQFKIHPFNFFESCQCFKNFSPTDMAIIYGIVGGTAQYLIQINDTLSVEDNIKQKILDPNAYLFEEPINLLKQEVREAALYNAIIAAIATGSTKLSEIAGKVSEETSACSACLKKLIALGIIKKERPFAEKSTKKTIYGIDDNLFRFWYRFIPLNMSILQNSMIDAAYSNISGQMNTFMGAVFEEICKQYLWALNRLGKCAFTFTNLGRWWGCDPKTKSQTEIDIIGTPNDKKTALFGECKWTNEKVDAAVLHALVRRSKLFRYEKVFFYLFSRSGFTKGCVDAAVDMGNTKLVTYQEMMEMSSIFRMGGEPE